MLKSKLNSKLLILMLKRSADLLQFNLQDKCRGTVIGDCYSCTAKISVEVQ